MADSFTLRHSLLQWLVEALTSLREAHSKGKAMGSSESGPVAAAIRSKLERAFAPDGLSILDESHLHAGHAGHDKRGESHFAVVMQSAAFQGKSRVDRQRMVYAVLETELKDRVHALRLSLQAPGENPKA